MQDDPRDVELDHDADLHDDLDAQALISAAVAEARRYVRRNEMRTNSALDAISDWIEKSEMRHADEAKRLASSQERVASAMRDALGLMTGRLNQIEKLVAEAPARAFEPIRSALGRLDDRVSLMESQHSVEERNSQQFSSLMESLGQRVAGVVEKIDELADARDRDDPKMREERIAGIEAKLGSILQQLTRTARTPDSSPPSPSTRSSAPAAPPTPPAAPLRSVTSSGRLDATVEDMRREQDEPGVNNGSPSAPRASGAAEASEGIVSLRAELGALAGQLQRLEEGRLDPVVLNELLSTTSEVRRLLADPAMPRLAAAIERGVAELTARIDSLTTKLADREEIAALSNAVVELNAKLAQPLSDVVERRLEALSAKIDAVMREPLTLVGQHLADLSSRLPASNDSGASHDALLDIRARLDRIAAWTDAPASSPVAPNEADALAEIKERLDRLSAKLDQAPAETDGATLDELRGRLEQLAQSVERSAAQTPETLDRLLRQIAASLQGSPKVESGPGAVQALERQIAALTERIGSAPLTDNAINALEQSIAKLSDELAETKTATMQAAEAAASGAAAQATSAMRQQRATGERELHATLIDMNSTLGHIMGRLSDLEEARSAASKTRLPPASELSGTTAPYPHANEPANPVAPTDEHAALEQEPEPSDEIEGEFGAFEAAALEAARNAAERAAQRGEGTQALSEHPGPSDEPLEPGSGRPSPASPPLPASGAMDDLILGSGDDTQAPAGTFGAPTGGGPMSAQALIAAARRAAAESAAREKSDSSPGSARGAAQNALSSLKIGAGLRRKPILLALIGLIAAFGAVGAGKLLLGNWPFGLDQWEPSFSPAQPEGGRSSSLSPQASPASPKAKQATAGNGETENLSLPANDVVGSIANPARDASSAQQKPAGDGTVTAAALADPTNAPDLLARLKLAADAEDATAEYELAARLFDGRGLPRDPQAAARLFERAANQGLAPAQYRLAIIYETGIGVPKDLAIARGWFEKAADRGNAKAMHNVGVYLAQGIQGKPDYATAVSWFRKAAERDVRDSQFNLGILMARGLGTLRDFKSSYVWFALAARDGDADSAAKRDQVAQRLSSTELDEAKAMIANFKPLELDRGANEVELKNIKGERVAPVGGEHEPAKTSKL
jgi:localization factor PodJL